MAEDAAESGSRKDPYKTEKPIGEILLTAFSMFGLTVRFPQAGLLKPQYSLGNLD
jgi:hypothetical protein